MGTFDGYLKKNADSISGVAINLDSGADLLDIRLPPDATRYIPVIRGYEERYEANRR